MPPKTPTSTLRLWQVLKPRLAAEGLVSVYERLERPLVPVLARMEERGISVDRQILSPPVGRFRAARRARSRTRSTSSPASASTSARPSSSATSCSASMGLPGGTKTKTGAWSTRRSVLEELAAEGHELPRTHRRLAPADQAEIDLYRRAARLHQSRDRPRPHLLRAGLDADRPALLVRSEPAEHPGPHRRRAARSAPPSSPTPGNKLISADYSQIELRVLAHVADIPQLKQAFADGLDIHAMTASEMFGVPVEGMPAEVRRRAKAINFGIIYGISAFGLANQLSIARERGRRLHQDLFRALPRHPRLHGQHARRCAREQRLCRRPSSAAASTIPNIRSSNPSIRAFIERASINAPIQGSAADIIRRAMIRMDDALARGRAFGAHAAAGA